MGNLGILTWSLLIGKKDSLCDDQVRGPYQDVTGHEHVHPAAIGEAYDTSDFGLFWANLRHFFGTLSLKTHIQVWMRTLSENTGNARYFM